MSVRDNLGAVPRARIVGASPIVEEAGALARLSVPIMLIATVNMGMSVTDTLVISAAFGSAALAAVAIGSDFYSILFYLGAGNISGLAPFYAAAVVKGDLESRVRLDRTGQVVVVLLAAILGLQRQTLLRPRGDTERW